MPTIAANCEIANDEGQQLPRVVHPMRAVCECRVCPQCHCIHPDKPHAAARAPAPQLRSPVSLCAKGRQTLTPLLRTPRLHLPAYSLLHPFHSSFLSKHTIYGMELMPPRQAQTTGGKEKPRHNTPLTPRIHRLCQKRMRIAYLPQWHTQVPSSETQRNRAPTHPQGSPPGRAGAAMERRGLLLEKMQDEKTEREALAVLPFEEVC